jgi:hypothetical protein
MALKRQKKGYHQKKRYHRTKSKKKYRTHYKINKNKQKENLFEGWKPKNFI